MKKLIVFFSAIILLAGCCSGGDTVEKPKKTIEIFGYHAGQSEKDSARREGKIEIFGYKLGK